MSKGVVTANEFVVMSGLAGETTARMSDRLKAQAIISTLPSLIKVLAKTTRLSPNRSRAM
jgi:hypothetical protein